MPWREDLLPVRMARVALVAPEARWRRVLEDVADAGLLEPDGAGLGEPPAGGAGFEAVTGASTERDGVRAIAGWAPAAAVGDLDERLAPLGGTVVELAHPPGKVPPTLLRPPSSGRAAVQPLVDTYATVPYRDVDPTWFAAAAYVVMFGMMFGDVGDGALLVMAALWLRQSHHAGLASVRRVWPLVVALGVSAMAFGVLYGEFFGPTGLIAPVWLDPLDDPALLLAAAVAVGAGLLAVAYGLGVVNRWREGGPRLALYAPSGVAGAALFLALALVAGGLYWGQTWLWAAGAVIGAVAVILLGAGLWSAAGGGAAGAAQASVELVDTVIRLGSNVVSFARLAAFGLTHAALGQVVWDGTTSLWDAGGVGVVLAVVVFVVGRAVVFALEALVAGIQALRLEYYELFSRVFVTEGRPFRPWHVPRAPTEESP